MNYSAIERRFICRACGNKHPRWEARCPHCLNHEALVQLRDDASDVPIAASAPATTTTAAATALEVEPSPLDEVEVPIQEPTRSAPSPPVLRIVRMPPPEPTLEVDELVDEDLPPENDEDESSSVPVSLADVDEVELPRDSTGLAPLDAVLGGGLVPGTVVALTGIAGGGKSTLTMQMLAGLNLRVLLATGEETVAQAATRARRIGAATKKVLIVAETDLDVVFAHARKTRAQVLMIDSVQTIICTDVKSAAGSPQQVREATGRLVKFAKDTDTSVIVTAHMTSDDRMAGPTTLRHLVDVVLELELGTNLGGNERILRCLGKNRFGPSNIVGKFELTGEGLVPIDGDDWNEPL